MIRVKANSVHNRRRGRYSSTTLYLSVAAQKLLFQLAQAKFLTTLSLIKDGDSSNAKK